MGQITENLVIMIIASGTNKKKKKTSQYKVERRHQEQRPLMNLQALRHSKTYYTIYVHMIKRKKKQKHMQNEPCDL